jgi:hypothetical protein
MSGDPLRDLDCAPRIHVFGNARRTEAVTTNSFQDPARPRPFLNQLQDTPTIQASRFNRFMILTKGRKKRSTRFAVYSSGGNRISAISFQRYTESVDLRVGSDVVMDRRHDMEFYSRSRTHRIAKCCSSVAVRKFIFSLTLARYVSTVATPS